MKTYLHVFFATLLSLSIMNSHAQSQQERRVRSFDKLSVTGGIEVVAKKANEASLFVEVEGIPLSKVITEVEAQELKIRLKPGVYNDIRVIVYLTYTHIREIQARIGAEVELSGQMRQEFLVVSASSGASISCDFIGGKIIQRAKEGGKIYVRGNVDTQDVRCFTGGKVFAKEMRSREAYVKLHTGGEAHIFVTEDLQAVVGSISKLTYKGEPAKKSIESSFGGNVSDLSYVDRVRY